MCSQFLLVCSTSIRRVPAWRPSSAVLRRCFSAFLFSVPVGPYLRLPSYRSVVIPRAWSSVKLSCRIVRGSCNRVGVVNSASLNSFEESGCSKSEAETRTEPSRSPWPANKLAAEELRGCFPASRFQAKHATPSTYDDDSIFHSSDSALDLEDNPEQQLRGLPLEHRIAATARLRHSQCLDGCCCAAGCLRSCAP